MNLDRLPFSLPLLVLDAVGVLLIGGGALRHVGLFEMLPLEQEAWGLPLMVAGFLLTLPFAVDLLRRARTRQAAQAAARAAPAQSTVRRG